MELIYEYMSLAKFNITNYDFKIDDMIKDISRNSEIYRYAYENYDLLFGSSLEKPGDYTAINKADVQLVPRATYRNVDKLIEWNRKHRSRLK
jgi:hypothetical protein